jgi:hypothetical protein
MRNAVIAALIVALSATTLAQVQAQTVASDDLIRHAIERRAIEAVNWGIPVVNFDRLVQAMVRDAKGNFNQVLYWSKFLDSKNQHWTLCN